MERSAGPGKFPSVSSCLETRRQLAPRGAPREPLKVEATKDGVLDTAYGLGEDARKRRHGTLRIEVSCETEAGEVASVYQRSFKLPLSGNPATQSRWRRLELDLSQYSGQTIQLRFESQFAEEGEAFRDVRESAPELEAIWAVPQFRPRKLKDKRNVILISLDTLGADHLGYAGYHRDTSPNLDALAAKGTHFSAAISQAPWTTPSHFSMLTSLYPGVHGGKDPVYILGSARERPSAPLASRILGDKGYVTAAFTASAAVSAEWGFAQGFDSFVETRIRGHSDAAIIFAQAARWLGRNRDRTFFLFLHVYEIHYPYRETYFLRREKIPNVRDDGSESEAVIAHRTARYDGGIRRADAELGVLFARIGDLGLLDNTLIVVTSDHGEDLGGRVPPGPDLRSGHGYDLDDSMLRVPLLFVGPGIPARADGIASQVRSIDILPTIVDYLGFDVPAHFQGSSLLAMVQGEEAEPRPAFAEATTYGSDRVGLRYENFKYVHRIGVGSLNTHWRKGFQATPLKELYDLAADPRELENLASRMPERVERMQKKMDEIRESGKSLNIPNARDAVSVPSQHDTGSAEGVENQLRALGYLD